MIIYSVSPVWLLRSFGSLALIALLLGSPLGASATPQLGGTATPRIVLDPVSGPCATRVAVYGGDFTPDVTVRFILTRDRDGAVTAANSQGGGQLVASNGTVTMVIPIIGCGPDEPIGSTFTITIFEYRSGSTPSRGPEASATFTVTRASAPLPGLPNTGGGGQAAPRLPLLAIIPLACGLFAAGGIGWRRRRVGAQRQPR